MEYGNRASFLSEFQITAESNHLEGRLVSYPTTPSIFYANQGSCQRRNAMRVSGISIGAGAGVILRLVITFLQPQGAPPCLASSLINLFIKLIIGRPMRILNPLLARHSPKNQPKTPFSYPYCPPNATLNPPHPPQCTGYYDFFIFMRTLRILIILLLSLLTSPYYPFHFPSLNQHFNHQPNYRPPLLHRPGSLYQGLRA